ncbi:MAG: hypothetical protein P8M18_06210 [Woeseiaceae bacterium]|nr:hypothetical protein [Woeseiaceae bacterium]
MLVLTVGDIGSEAVDSLLNRFELTADYVSNGQTIPGSFWGEPEAGIVGKRVFVRADTPVHSLLHEVCHIICMNDERRANLNRDAGSDDIEEAAVCYLQMVFADYLPGVGRERLARDMDTWGYSFRLGNTLSWFEEDARDASDWLVEHRVLDPFGYPLFRLRDH